ncbi:unnamed protein product [Rotaria sp. Silwood1]|nr:unnamed protein product [Rotaria sp. Silwood1]
MWCSILLCIAIAAIVTYFMTVGSVTKSEQATDSTNFTTVSTNLLSTASITTSPMNGSTSSVNTTSLTTDTTTNISLLSNSTTAASTLQWNTTGLTVAGMGIFSTAANGLNYPFSMALDATASNVYITDRYNNRVQKWPIGGSTGQTVAGQSTAGAGSNASSFHIPCGIVLDSTGGFYVADSSNYRIQYWSNGASSGITVAGTGKQIRSAP